jgi:uncharacterized protein (TIGR02453 family)
MPRPVTASKTTKTVPVFTAETLKFLRGLRRNNDREWFEPRRPVYEKSLRAPMLALIARVNEGMARFAPAHVKAPEKTVLRIYRDTRFSNNKLPYKQHYAAWWGRTGMVKTSGAGFYFHLAPKTLTIAAGLYMPDAAQLLAVRRYLLEHHDELRRLFNARKLTAKMQLSDPQALTRAPKGFPKDHPGLDLILYRNWAVDTEMPSTAALDRAFAKTLTTYFETAAPLVEFLNRPIAIAVDTVRRPIFALNSF